MAATAGSGGSQTMERDLAYGSDPMQRLDLTVPAARGFPTVLFVHGGGLTSGDKAESEYRSVCDPFVASGIGCASMNYRLAPSHSWPAPAEDVASAVAWLRANLGARGGDSRNLILLGHSSGAMLVALIGSDERYLARHGLKPDAVRGIVAMGSIMWDVELEEALERHGLARVEEAFRRDPDNAFYGSLTDYRNLWPIRHLRRGMPLELPRFRGRVRVWDPNSLLAFP
jgi:pimeloyl-ACP methyl ester carboxylesterase